jgi:hypothetical protein
MSTSKAQEALARHLSNADDQGNLRHGHMSQKSVVDVEDSQVEL